MVNTSSVELIGAAAVVVVGDSNAFYSMDVDRYTVVELLIPVDTTTEAILEAAAACIDRWPTPISSAREGLIHDCTMRHLIEWVGV